MSVVGPIRLEELQKNTDNLYEAVVVLAKRARQVNERRYGG